MFNMAEDICSMTEFKRRTAVLISRLRGTGRALVLTTNGKADIVVQDVAAYQRLVERLAAFENPRSAAEAAAPEIDLSGR